MLTAADKLPTDIAIARDLAGIDPDKLTIDSA